jgi:hypothetical protein
MLSLLFVFGFLFGIAVTALVAVGVVSAVMTALAWLNMFVVILSARSSAPAANRHLR